MPFVEKVLIGVLITLGIALAFIFVVSAYGYGRPVSEPTNQTWPCSYPYPMGLCQKDK